MRSIEAIPVPSTHLQHLCADPNPGLVGSASNGEKVIGPGHASFVEGDNGTFFAVYAASIGNNCNRLAFVEEMRFNDETGWPYINFRGSARRTCYCEQLNCSLFFHLSLSLSFSLFLFCPCPFLYHLPACWVLNHMAESALASSGSCSKRVWLDLNSACLITRGTVLGAAKDTREQNPGLVPPSQTRATSIHSTPGRVVAPCHLLGPRDRWRWTVPDCPRKSWTSTSSTNHTCFGHLSDGSGALCAV